MTRLNGNGLPLADWIAWSEVRGAHLSRAGLDVILTLLAEKESRLCDPPTGTPLIPLDADPGDADPLSVEEQGREGRSEKVVR